MFLLYYFAIVALSQTWGDGGGFYCFGVLLWAMVLFLEGGRREEADEVSNGSFSPVPNSC